MILRPILCVVMLLCWTGPRLEGNGGAWQVGVPSTGNAAATNKKHSTNVAIEDESLTIDLHQEFAAIEVRYRMKNSGPKVAQDFFFPVERWAPEEGEADVEGGKPADLDDYRVTADGAELKWKTVDVPASAKARPEPVAETSATPAAVSPNEESANDDVAGEETGERWDEVPTSKHWKKSEIPFAANQTREIVVRYRVGYSGYERSVSDDAHASDRGVVYSLSPAATWKGSIGHGKIVINVLHPTPEEVEIARPKDRFKKISETRYQWEFRDLEPTLADDLKIVAHRAYDSNPVSYGNDGEEGMARPDYLTEGDHYFLLHADFDATASSTLAASSGHNYDVKNIRSIEPDVTWAEGANGDGIGESLTLNVTRPLPLTAIMVMPGFNSSTNPSLWLKNNRVAELEVTLNGEQTFTAKIPDEKFTELYPIVVRDYAAPVKTVKLVVKGVYRGTAAHDTCISQVRLKAKLTSKPEIHPAR